MEGSASAEASVEPEVNAHALASGDEPEINAAVTPDRRVIKLEDAVSAETVVPIIEQLDQAAPAEKLMIYIRANGGGDIYQLIQLFKGLYRTQADVELAIGRYAMSAAATLWFEFFLTPRRGNNGVGRVVSVDPIKPAVLLYHRPRWPYDSDDSYHCFVEHFEDETVRKQHDEMVAIFDELFERILALQGYGQIHAATVKHDGAVYKHHLHYAREAYYGNNDYVISMKGVEA
ncbi:hypothetical protein [Pseudomonas soli]|uniref:hypothetical protein n=1 Tax=Pseudomonas soli TaxID=1306993 RepID=UPI003DA98EA8